jgi:hypothetical protein
MVPLRRRLVLFLDNLVVVIGILIECRGNRFIPVSKAFSQGSRPFDPGFGRNGGRIKSEKFRSFSRGSHRSDLVGRSDPAGPKKSGG